MGAGPVFIVYACLNLNKNAAFPAATWLLVLVYFLELGVVSRNLQCGSIYYGDVIVCSGQSHKAVVLP